MPQTASRFNWAALYLSSERGVSPRDAPLALAAFWVAVTVGRVAIAFLDRVVSPRRVYVALPLLLAAAFQLVARADGLAAGIGGFAAAGLACSAMLPFTISFAGTRFPRRAPSLSLSLLRLSP